MKRRLKSLFRLAGGFVILGTVMIIIGLLFGGAGELSKEVKELVHVARIGVSETVERIPLLESITNINGFTLVVDRDEVSVEVNEQYETLSGDYSDYSIASVAEVKNLDISVTNGICTILPSDNEYFGVESRNAEEFQCYVSGDTLYLSIFPRDFGEKSENAEIVLYVPEGVECNKVLMFCSGEQVMVDTELKGNELNISSICGMNEFREKLVFQDVTATVGIGSFTAEEINCSDLKLEVSTAEAQIGNMEAECVEINLGMGTLSVCGTTSGDIVLNCGMGHFDMVLDDRQDSYNYDISGSAESVQIGTDTLAGMVMERWIDNGSDKQITMSCSMGSVKIEFCQ